MPRKEGQKLKLLTLLEIFVRETDEKHPISVPRMVELLKERGIVAERKSVYDDIQTLNEMPDTPFEIVQQRGREHDGRERLKIPHTATVCTGSCPIAEKYQQQPSPVFTAPSSTIHPRSSGRMLTANPRSRMPMNTAAVRKPKSICSAAFSCPVMCTARLFSVIITA